jgi:hypothetical protein
MIRSTTLLVGLVITVSAGPVTRALADEQAKANSATTTRSKKAAVDVEPPTMDLLQAMRNRSVSAFAKGTGDGRMSISITNRTRGTLRVVLPPGIVAQGATGQFGGMGGMGGGMGGMGGGMGGGGGRGGGMGGGRGGMGGGMGGGMMRGGTMPPMMGLMMLSRLIMYFCGDYDSWDMRAMMMAMGGMGGGMGGMGGGMMGGMGGGMGGMGGGMRSVPPTSLPFADLKPSQTRVLPTRVVVLTSPSDDGTITFPSEGEELSLTSIAETNDDPRVQKALKRLAADKISRPVAQLVMWNLSAGLEWETIAQMSANWANAYELALARDFVARLDELSEGESGRLLFQFDPCDKASEALASKLAAALKGQTVLGLSAEIGIPARPEGPVVACRVRLSAGEAIVQVTGSDQSSRNWTNLGKFSLSVAAKADSTIDERQVLDELAEGVLNRLVRMQLIKGPREKGKLTYGLRIDNASPLILNGLAALGSTSGKDDTPRVLSGISLPPRKSMTVPASEDVVNRLGLRKGIRLVALDLSGL